MSVFVCIYVNVCVSACVSMCICVCVFGHTNMYMCMRECVCLFSCIRMCVFMYIWEREYSQCKIPKIIDKKNDRKAISSKNRSIRGDMVPHGPQAA